MNPKAKSEISGGKVVLWNSPDTVDQKQYKKKAETKHRGDFAHIGTQRSNLCE